MWDAHTCITEHSQHYSKLILGGIVLNSTEWYQLVLGTLFLHQHHSRGWFSYIIWQHISSSQEPQRGGTRRSWTYKYVQLPAIYIHQCGPSMNPHCECVQYYVGKYMCLCIGHVHTQIQRFQVVADHCCLQQGMK